MLILARFRTGFASPKTKGSICSVALNEQEGNREIDMFNHVGLTGANRVIDICSIILVDRNNRYANK